MNWGKSFGLALVGTGVLVAASSAALAGDDAVSLQDRVKDLEQQVQALKTQLGRQGADEPLGAQIDRYLQGQEKGELWRDRNGNALSKSVKSVWLQGSLRIRPHWQHNLVDFSGETDDSGLQTFTRARLGLGVEMNGGWAFFNELNMAGSWGSAGTVYANDGGSTIVPALYQSYVKTTNWEPLKMGVQVGRFEMVYGDEYVIGDRDFTQAGLFFDGVRLSKDWGNGFKADIFYSKLVEGFKVGGDPDQNVYLFGIYGNWYGSEKSLGMPGGLEPYYILVKDNADTTGVGGVKTRDVHTLGVHWYHDKATKEKGGVGMDINANIQQTGGGTAWSGDAKVKYTMSTSKWKPVVWGQLAYASGSRTDPTQSYNPLFQDAHARYGYSDAWFFSNLMLAGVGVDLTHNENTSYGAALRSYRLARAPSGPGSDSKRVGWELDLYAKHKYNENVSLEAAFAFIGWRGGASEGFDDATRAYVNLVIAF